MADKTFDPIVDRKIPSIDGLQERLHQKAEYVYQLLQNPESCIDRKGVGNWTPAEVSREISRITDGDPNHEIDKVRNAGKHYKGLYVWGEPKDNKMQPLYVGISQNLERRISGHVRSDNRAIATWRYMMAKHDSDSKQYAEELRQLKVKDPKFWKYRFPEPKACSRN